MSISTSSLTYTPMTQEVYRSSRLRHVNGLVLVKWLVVLGGTSRGTLEGCWDNAQAIDNRGNEYGK